MKKQFFFLFVLTLAIVLSACAPAAPAAAAATPSPSPMTIDELKAVADQQIADGDYASALATLDQIISADPANDDAYMLKAEVQFLIIDAAYADLNSMMAKDVKSVSDTDAYLLRINDLSNEHINSVTMPVVPYSGPVNRNGNTQANLAAYVLYSNTGEDYSGVGGVFAFEGEYLYYVNVSDTNALYRVKKDGSGKMKISEDSVSNINVVAGWVYYIAANDNNAIYKVQINGLNRTKLSDDSAASLFVRDDHVFYSNANDNNMLYSIDCNGENKISYGESANVVFADDYSIYFSTPDQMSLYKINTDTAEVSAVFENQWFMNPQLYDGWIYFVGEGDPLTIKKIKIDGTEQTDVWAYDSKINAFLISYGNLYVETRAQDKTELYMRIDLATAEVNGQFTDCPSLALCADDSGNTYFVSREGLFRLNWDTLTYEQVD